MKKILLLSLIALCSNVFGQRILADLKSDSFTGTTTIHVGIDSITGLEVYRRFKTLESDTHDKQHRISYEEWLVAQDGNVYQDFYSIKTYIVVDNVDTQHLSYTAWFNQLAPSLLPAINQTLLIIPRNAPNNYVVTQ